MRRNAPAFAAIGLLALTHLAPLAARAQDSDTAKLTGRLHYSTDTDDFVTQRLSAGYLWSHGWGLESRVARYSAPGWSAQRPLAIGRVPRKDGCLCAGRPSGAG